MSAKRSIYNEGKANAVFAVKIRKLFEESGKTHNNLAEYIEQRLGESVTRQAVGQWCNGNTCPNLRTVPIIAEFFGVSTDYLLTDTDIKTFDTEIKAICNYTGLSDNTIEKLHMITKKDAEWGSMGYIPTVFDYLMENGIGLLEDIHDYLLDTFELVCLSEDADLYDVISGAYNDKNHLSLLLSMKKGSVKILKPDTDAMLLAMIQEKLIGIKSNSQKEAGD